MSEPDEALIWARKHKSVSPSMHSTLAHGYRSGQAASAERIKALEEELAKANKPTYFYFDPVEGETFESLHDAVIAAAAEAGANWGRWVIPVYAARTLPLIYAAVRIRTDTGQDCNNRLLFQITECATEAEAKALLKEADQ
jgi:hypothetical protein